MTRQDDSADSSAIGTLGIQDAGSVRFVLAQLVGIGLRVLGADEGSLLVVTPENRTLRFAMVCGPDGMPPPSGTADSMIGREVPIGEGITGMAALTHDVQCASETAGRSGIRFHRVAGDGSPHAVLAAPMLLGDDLIGVMTAVSFDPRKTFSSEESRTYGMLANVAASVVDQQRRMEAAARRRRPQTTDVGAEPEERALVKKALSFARSGTGRIEVLDGIISALERIP